MCILSHCRTAKVSNGCVICDWQRCNFILQRNLLAFLCLINRQHIYANFNRPVGRGGKCAWRRYSDQTRSCGSLPSAPGLFNCPPQRPPTAQFQTELVRRAPDYLRSDFHSNLCFHRGGFKAVRGSLVSVTRSKADVDSICADRRF